MAPQAADDDLGCLARWPVERDLARLLTLFEDPGKPGFVCIKELDDGLLHGL